MKKVIFSLVIFAISPTLQVFNQTIMSVNICNEVDWKTNQEMTAKNDSIYEIELDYTKSKDLNNDFFVSTKFRILYDNSYKWIGGSFPTDTTGDIDSAIPVPYGLYSVKINVNTFQYQFINPDNDFYKFSNTDLDSNEVIYCQIVGTSKWRSNKVTVEIDFGQYKPKGKGSKLVDEKTGQPILFNSMIDALNYMGKFGWVYVQAYTIGEHGYYVYHYLLKKNNE